MGFHLAEGPTAMLQEGTGGYKNWKSKEHTIFLQLSKSITRKPRKTTMDAGA